MRCKMKFTKSFKGVKAGEIYPTDFEPGDECPPDLLEAAQSLDAVEAGEDENPAPVVQPILPSPAEKENPTAAELEPHVSDNEEHSVAEEAVVDDTPKAETAVSVPVTEENPAVKKAARGSPARKPRNSAKAGA
jgi:hypothetical protein